MCEHAFCRNCIQEWISRQPICPLDRTPITGTQLRPAPRILRNLLARLCINCDNLVHGCQAIIKLDSLSTHLEECEFNPKRLIPCELGCSLIIPKDEIKNHNCVRELMNLIQSQRQKLSDMKRELSEQQFQLNEQKREIQLLKEFMKAIRISNPLMKTIADQMERDEIVRWAGTLPRARVTRWGGMISTPDELLQVNYFYLKLLLFFNTGITVCLFCFFLIFHLGKFLSKNHLKSCILPFFFFFPINVYFLTFYFFVTFK